MTEESQMPFEDRDAKVLVPVTVEYRLYYDHDYAQGNGKFDYLQLVRSRALFAKQNAKQLEEGYWAGLQQNRSDFAAGLDEPFDLIVDPPSNSGYHRPFLSAFIAQTNFAVRVVRLIKNTHVRSCPENLGELRANIKFFGETPENLVDHMNVLVVDDVFSSGTIMAIVIEKLIAAGLSKDAMFTLACPLRMPPVANDPDAQAIQAMLQGAGG
jgi:hypothetical protein